MALIKTLRLSLVTGAIGAVLFIGVTTVSAEAEGKEGVGPGDYTVIDGKVDQGTYDGYIAYTRSCMACHGPDGLGSSFAPSLIKRAQQRSFAEFARTIAGGLQIQPGKVMPSFADDEYVLSNIENIYSYMQARGAEEVGRGRPKVIAPDADADKKEIPESTNNKNEESK
ncbi:c-type cytochrome [Halomonas sp. M20]|uniref:c-type cytochrome n=1 Tax=Halomonas sp. M20 TaxID=2763264 RepID=UPI001D0A59FC|nr:cytochrome c [Halomonas sp. M20]